MLGVKKVDSALKWCEGKSIKVCGDRGNRWVPALDVARVLDGDFIDYLIEKYGGENWFAVYSIYQNNDMEALVRLNHNSKVEKLRPRPSHYEPKSEASAKFLNEFK